MRPISAIRRANLIHIIETRFASKQVSAAVALGVQPNLISRWKGEKPIGNAAARKIEQKLGLDMYWMDQDRDSTVPAEVDSAIGATIARNLREWMDNSDKLNTQSKLQKASQVSQSTIQRVLSSDVDPTVGVINSIAGAFGRHGYELMMPASDQRQIVYDRSAYAALPEEERAKIRSFIEFVISQNRKDDTA